MKTELESMHYYAYQIPRHAPISFPSKRFKEGLPFAVHENGNGLSSQVPATQKGGGGRSFAARSGTLAAQSSPPIIAHDEDLISTNIPTPHTVLRFAESIVGHGEEDSIQLKSNNNSNQAIQNSNMLMAAVAGTDEIAQGDLQGGLLSAAAPEWNPSSSELNENRSNNFYEDYSPSVPPAAADEAWPMLGVSLARGLGNLDAGCMEKLLVHCGSALESNDVTLAQQIMWVLNNIASAEGDPNQRVTACFLRALVSRASRMGTPNASMLTGMHAGGGSTSPSNKLSVIELAGFVDLTPWHRFGFSASNGAIVEAVQGHSKVHIIDFGIAHCMQWPTLIDTLAKRPEGPPFLRLTVCNCARPDVPPLLDMSYEDLGLRLSNFARTRNVPFEFRVIPSPPTSPASNPKPNNELLLEQLQPSVLDLRPDEALVINCQLRLHYLPDETADPALASSSSSCARDEFLRIIRSFEPTIVTLVDEDSNLTSTSLASRLKTAFNYLWIPFDALDTFLPKDSKQRQQYEADVGYKIENIIAFEGHQRIERLESKAKCVQRMRKARFQCIPFSEESFAQVKTMLDDHAAGWGLKKDEDGLLLTWKGHNVVFATVWVPSS